MASSAKKASAFGKGAKSPTGILSSGGGQKQDRSPKQTPAVKAALREAYANHNDKPVADGTKNHNS